jgi:DNA-binding response OmpR family regulator
MHILIVEDNSLVASGIKAGLELHGFACDIAPNLALADRHLTAGHFDACVLDLGLPDGDGLALLRSWRAAGLQLPVLILTARGTIEDKVAGFQTGTDDYLTKPFDLQELVLRLHALLRRAGGRATDLMALGDCQVNTGTGRSGATVTGGAVPPRMGAAGGAAAIPRPGSEPGPAARQPVRL